MAENISLDDLKTTKAEEPGTQADATEKIPGRQTPSWKREFKPVSIGEIAENMPQPEVDETPSEEDILGNAMFKLDEGVERYKEDIKKNLIDPQMKKVEEYNAAVQEIKDEQAMDELLADANGSKEPINMSDKIKSEEEELFDDEDDEEIDLPISTPAETHTATLETKTGTPAPTVKEKTKSPATETTASSDTVLLDGLTDEEFEKAIGLTDDEEDENEEDEPKESEEEQEKRLNEFKEDIRSKIHPIKNTFNLAEFTISKKPISAAKILNAPSNVKVKTADWALMNSKRPIATSELSGIEIEKLNSNRRDRNIVNIVKERYSIIYDHLIDDNKPASLEAWMKLVAYADEPEIFYCLYKATFEDTNLVPYACPACKHTFMLDIPVDSMVEYPNENTKKLVEAIRRGDTTSVGEYKAKLIQITDEYVFALKTASIYSAVMEPAALDEAFVNKYNDLIGVISYIDEIFLIDAANKRLIPIDYKPDRTDFVKTVKRKIVAYTKIINRFTVDQTYLLNKAINDLDEKENSLNYIAPEAVCPKCGAKIPKENRDPLSMLFTRRQLAALSNI